MIKIEFKEAQSKCTHNYLFTFCDDKQTMDDIRFLKQQHGGCFYKSVTPYTPTQDPMLDRSHILSLLSISEQEDKLFQEQYKNV